MNLTANVPYLSLVISRLLFSSLCLPPQVCIPFLCFSLSLSSSIVTSFIIMVTSNHNCQLHWVDWIYNCHSINIREQHSTITTFFLLVILPLRCLKTNRKCKTVSSSLSLQWYSSRHQASNRNVLVRHRTKALCFDIGGRYKKKALCYYPPQIRSAQVDETQRCIWEMTSTNCMLWLNRS